MKLFTAVLRGRPEDPPGVGVRLQLQILTILSQILEEIVKKTVTVASIHVRKYGIHENCL
jgi:hypothetical protein